MNSITINGKLYSGNSIIVNNNKVFIDGKEVTPDQKEVTITVAGNVGSIKVDACKLVSVTGDCTTAETTSGNIEIGGNVSGSVKTMSGNIHCGNVGGNASTMSGNIRRS
jgi:hypothetical protein